MHETSRLQVGDDIYDLDKGIRVGTISELYRYWRDRDEGVRDTSAHCDYEYETRPGCRDNTSRQYGSFGTRGDAIHRAEMRTSLLRSNR
jgi:MoaA/NifB/PqqE/SkfB family radical SAM enzyme